MSPQRAEFIRRAGELGLTTHVTDTAAIDTAATDTAATDVAFDAAAARLTLPWPAGALAVDLSAVAAAERGRLVTILTHFHADLCQREQDARAIDGFTQQLSQSYEEVNLVYRMAKLLTSDGAPGEVVRAICEELRGTLNYGWLAMAFGDGPAVLAPLRRTMPHAGTLPYDHDLFRADCRLAVHADSGRVLTPGRHPLADRAGCEVLAEHVSHGDAAVGVLVAGNRQHAESDVTSSEIQLVGAAANFLGLFHQNAFRFAEQRRQFVGTLHALSGAVDAKDPYTRGHSERVGLIGRQLALAAGMDAATADAVRVAGLLHDIGKIGVPEAVLRKPARLTDDEFALIKKHPEIGYEILRDLPSLEFHLPGVLHHHERWDGRGYPHQVAGEAIPMIARILAYADTFDAMSSSRAYRKGLERSYVLAELRKSAGTQLDPGLIDAFCAMDFTEFDRMLMTQENLSDAGTPAAATNVAA